MLRLSCFGPAWESTPERKGNDWSPFLSTSHLRWLVELVDWRLQTLFKAPTTVLCPNLPGVELFLQIKPLQHRKTMEKHIRSTRPMGSPSLYPPNPCGTGIGLPIRVNVGGCFGVHRHIFHTCTLQQVFPGDNRCPETTG